MVTTFLGSIPQIGARQAIEVGCGWHESRFGMGRGQIEALEVFRMSGLLCYLIDIAFAYLKIAYCEYDRRPST